MKVIICLDKYNGRLFNNRRQSRDSKVMEDIARYIKNNTLWIEEYSLELFKDYPNVVTVGDDILKSAKQGDFCFVERTELADTQLEELIIYRWDKSYPSDKKFAIDYSSMKLKGKLEFKGTSHNKITREVYVR